MSATSELEVLLKKAITLLHSSEANSAQELRLILDEEIRKRYGPEKMLSSTLNKKHMDAEANFPGRAVTPPPKPPEEIINLINSPAKTISDSPDTIIDSDDAISGQVTETGMLANATVEDETNLKEFGDLNCCVCGEMMFTATNRLIECFKCGALYHQECHKPAITDEEISDEQAHNWQCDNCLNKPTTTKAAGIVMIPDEPMPLVTNPTIPTITKSKSSATSSRSSSTNSSSSIYKGDHGGHTSKSGGAAKSRDDKYAAIPLNANPHHNIASPASHSSSSSSKKPSSHSHSSSSSSKSKSTSRNQDNKKKTTK